MKNSRKTYGSMDVWRNGNNKQKVCHCDESQAKAILHTKYACHQPRSGVIPEGRNRESMLNKNLYRCLPLSLPIFKSSNLPIFRHFSSRCAFTLVELVLVISIVVVLSVISGPIYRSYAYKARQAEGYALLGTIRSAQENYYGEYGMFMNDAESSAGTAYWTCNEEVLGIDARPNKYYTWFNICRSQTNIRYDFEAVAMGSGAANLTMRYNRTSGVTMFSGGGGAE